MSNITLIFLLSCLWICISAIKIENGTTAAINNQPSTAPGSSSSSTLLPARERLKRLIPYMTFYLTPSDGQIPGGRTSGLPSRPILAAIPAKEGGYITYPSPAGQQTPPQPLPPPPPPPPQANQQYLLPIVVQPQQFQRQPPPPQSIPSNYPRFLIQQPSPLTKMITQNYLAIAKQINNNNNNGNPRVQATRLNSYSPQYKHVAVDHTLYKHQPQQQFVDQQQPITYKHQQLSVLQPAPFKQTIKVQPDPIIYGPQIQEDIGGTTIIYKQPQETQLLQPEDEPGQPLIQYQNIVTPEPTATTTTIHENTKLPQIQPEILTQFKIQDAIVPPLQYKKLIQQQDSPPKQYYIIRRPIISTTVQPPQLIKDDQQDDDSVTITQSQEIDVSTLSLPKYHAKYAARKPVIAITREQYPVSYQQQEDYDTLPLVPQKGQPAEDETFVETSQEKTHGDPNFDDVRNTELNNILGGFSLAKSLPDKITPENLDSSIKTLSKLLRILQSANSLPNSAKKLVSNFPRPKEHPFTTKVSKLAQKIPPSDQEGSTPGRAGIDYPAYDEIPETHFSCKEQRYKGFFGDPETRCQVWHYCDLNGGQASFLCPNGTIFSQVALTCDWWFNVKCASTAQLYVLNERLYKYILPQKLSFPEDFQGPLVDQYLSLKFRENEEKDKKKKEKAKTDGKAKEKDDKPDEELELPYSEDVATTQNKVRSIPED